MVSHGLRSLVVLGAMTAPACVPPAQVVQGVAVEPVPYDPSGRTAFIVEAKMSVNTFSGDVPDFVRSALGFRMDPGVGFGLRLGARAPDGAILAGLSLVTADAEDASTRLGQDLFTVDVTVQKFLPLSSSAAAPEAGGLTREFVVSLTAIPHATLLDNADDGWRGGLGFAVEAAFCHRIVYPTRPNAFEFLRYGLGFRSVSFDTFEITGFGSASVDDSLRSVYFMFSADQRF